MRTRKRPRTLARLAWAPLEQYLTVNFPDPDCYRDKLNGAGDEGYVMSATWIGELLHIAPGTVYRYRALGYITEKAADRYAVELGLHPSWIWGTEWFTSAHPKTGVFVCA